MACDVHYQFFICEQEIEAFDNERSDCTRYSDGGPWDVMRFELNLDAVEGRDIFRLQAFRSALFVSDRFVAAVEQHDLSGFWFEELWSSETGGVQRTLGEADAGWLQKNPRSTLAAKRAAVRAKQAAKGPVPKFL